jgi:nucleotide-binding universal stress UspA family protein
MSGIVCAIRGGPASQPTIARAIRLAEETRLPLYFLYVVNLDFLSYTNSSRVQIISQEMRQMGEFILLAAQSNAASAGVDAEGIVRQGKVEEEIIALCHEVEAEYLVVGRPHAKGEENAFDGDAMDAFVRRIEEQANARVILAEDENE